MVQTGPIPQVVAPQPQRSQPVWYLHPIAGPSPRFSEEHMSKHFTASDPARERTAIPYRPMIHPDTPFPPFPDSVFMDLPPNSAPQPRKYPPQRHLPVPYPFWSGSSITGYPPLPLDPGQLGSASMPMLPVCFSYPQSEPPANYGQNHERNPEKNSEPKWEHTPKTSDNISPALERMVHRQEALEADLRFLRTIVRSLGTHGRVDLKDLKDMLEKCGYDVKRQKEEMEHMSRKFLQQKKDYDGRS